jgi:ubiquinone/menaquinone biosynthesis C-methylase UbiE
MYRACIGWVERVGRGLVRRLRTAARADPASAYDLWSSTYDEDRENLLVLLDEAMFEGLLGAVNVRGRTVIDVGCGTGRHWDRILARGPAALIGYDASPGMRVQLKRKYPHAIVHLANGHLLANTPPQSCDLVVSTLALSHIQTGLEAFGEWARVLRGRGEVLITDFHPAAAEMSETTFSVGKRVITVKTYVHPMPKLKAAIAQSGLELLTFRETVLDESMRHRYERARMGRIFERMRGVPLLYGMHLRKRPA